MDARESILNLINRYGFTIDTGDLEAFATLFADGEWTVEGAEPKIGKAAMMTVMSNVRIYADGTPKTKHVTSNVDLIIDETAGVANSQCYVTVLQQTDAFPLQAIFSGHYFDDFVRVNGIWRFKKRLIRYGLVGDMSAHLKTPTTVIPGA